MYPTLYHAIHDLFGIEVQVLKLVNMFGFMVMLAFFSAATCLSSELKRRGDLGRFPRYNPPADSSGSQGESPISLLLSALLLAFFGYKLGGIVLDNVKLDGGYDAQKYLFSSQGSWIAALVVGLGWGGLRAYSLYKSKTAPATPQPQQPESVGPEVHTGGLTTAAAVGGLIGAKVFHWLETPESIPDLFRNPSLGNLFSGLTIYGGLIGGAYGCFRYARKHNLSFAEVCDANAPGLMLAYCVGRLGCQLSGDGDWGIANSNPVPGFLQSVPWLWSYDFPNNVVRAGEAMQSGGYSGYGTHLVPGVYPTPLYEACLALVWFTVLWALRKHVTQRWALFCIYLMMNGFARFFIEKIRVNAVYDVASFEFTQAELISVMFFLLGGFGLYVLRRPPPTARARKPLTSKT